MFSYILIIVLVRLWRVNPVKKVSQKGAKFVLIRG